jgi:ribosome-interacting GTPase 1
MLVNNNEFFDYNMSGLNVIYGNILIKDNTINILYFPSLINIYSNFTAVNNYIINLINSANVINNVLITNNALLEQLTYSMGIQVNKFIYWLINLYIG